MVFANGVKNIQAAAYNGVRTELIFNRYFTFLCNDLQVYNLNWNSKY